MRDMLGNLSVDWLSPRTPAADGTSGGDHAAEVPTMIAIGIGFLALFSLLSILLGNEDPRQVDPQDELRLWMRFGIR